MNNRPSFLLTGLAALFCVSLVVSNIVAGKLYQAPFGIVLTSAVWLFPIVYIVGDIVPEVYGLRTAQRIIWLAFGANAFAIVFFMLTLALPAPAFWTGQGAFTTVLGFTPRLLLSSFCAYIVGTHANAWVMVTMKRLTAGRWLWTRTISSTIVAETLDSTIFIGLAFAGVVPLAALPGMILAQAVFKSTYEIIATPLTYVVVAYAKRIEGAPA